MTSTDAKSLLLAGDPRFWAELAGQTQRAETFSELIALSALRRKALKRGLAPASGGARPLRLAILGGVSLYPLHELLTHYLAVAGVSCELFLGDYDNFQAEMMDAESALYAFGSEAILLLPGAQRCRYAGPVTDPPEAVLPAAEAVVEQLLALCARAHERCRAEILLGNFMLPARHGLGEFRTRTLASDWSFRKQVNLRLGLSSPAYVRICDLEFLSCRLGGLAAEDARGWFESKQPGSPALLVELAREAAQLILAARRAPKKVAALDLDNTLWGGVVADDGLEGIEIGDTSPRGEAFKAFQRELLALKQRGVLLAVCSKNDHARAAEVFEKHPEMVLRMSDFAAFAANWEPKSDNLRRLAAQLNLGLESIVFIDDNPAEIEIVRQFAPEVSTLWLGPDPSTYPAALEDSRFFEPRQITAEDAQRSGQYQAQIAREALLAGAADMSSYLASLEMRATIQKFTLLDVPRLAQLINKSNQFNLTTRRRTESEVEQVMRRTDGAAFSLRLQDRFGDHGLVSIVILESAADEAVIDTWVMSCRVLKRQVEEEMVNEMARVAGARGWKRLRGRYFATAKNSMVRDLYPRLGFATVERTPEAGEFVLELDCFQSAPSKISILQHAYEPD